VGIVGLALAVVAVALPTLYPSRPFLDNTNLTPADEIRYEVATRAFGGTSYDEFKPIWGDATPKDAPDLKALQAHPLRINVIDPGEKGVTVTQIDDHTAQVITDHALNLSFRQFYFPGWTALVDGAPVTPFPEERFGLVTLHVPAGSHTVSVRRETTPVEQIAPILTLISVIILIGMWRSGNKAVEEKIAALQPQTAWLLIGGIGAFALLNSLYIQPFTMWFRQQSPPDSPAYMQTAVHQRFGDTYELLGYSLHQNEAQPDAAFDVTLYWRALHPVDQDYQPVVQLVNPAVSAAWAVSQKFYIGETPLKHTPDYFVSDEHRLQVAADVPPYVGRLLVKLIDPQTGQPLLLPDGSDHLVLDARVRIQGMGVPAKKLLNSVIDGKLELWCAAVQQQPDQLHVSLYWHVLAPLATADVSVFVHGFDAQNQMVALYDGPLLNGDYAATDWLPGQNLVDQLTVPVKPGLERLSVGLHLASGDRLPVLTDGIAAPENRIWLPLATQSCLPP
jgi:hypothetical protein